MKKKKENGAKTVFEEMVVAWFLTSCPLTDPINHSTATSNLREPGEGRVEFGEYSAL